MIELAKNSLILSEHIRGPHFFLLHDRNLREDVDGLEVIELPLDAVISYLDQNNDGLGLEAMARILGNSGLSLNIGRWSAGERQPNMLFIQTGSRPAGDGRIHTDAQGQTFTSIHLLSIARILGNTQPHGGPESAQTIHDHIVAFIELLGVKANLERIQAEFCRTCGD